MAHLRCVPGANYAASPPTAHRAGPASNLHPCDGAVVWCGVWTESNIAASNKPTKLPEFHLSKAIGQHLVRRRKGYGSVFDAISTCAVRAIRD